MALNLDVHELISRLPYPFVADGTAPDALVNMFQHIRGEEPDELEREVDIYGVAYFAALKAGRGQELTSGDITALLEGKEVCAAAACAAQEARDKSGIFDSAMTISRAFDGIMALAIEKERQLYDGRDQEPSPPPPEPPPPARAWTSR